MQKIFIVFAILGLGLANANLRSEMDQLIEFANMEKVREIYNWWITHDAQVGEIYEFLKTDEVNEAWVILTTSNAEMKEISAWALERGVDLAEYLNRIASVLGLSPITPRALRNSASRSWAGMMEEIRAAQNLEGAQALAEQLINDPASEFGQLHRMIAAQHDSVHATFEDPAVRRVTAQLRAFGVDVDGFLARIYAFYGWNH